MESGGLLGKKELVLKVLKLIRPIDVVVVVTSIIAMYLFRLQDGFELNPIWQLKRSSGGQKTQVQPLVVDLDGNGLKELLIASENKIEMFSFHADEFDDEHGIHEKIQDDAKSSVLYHLHQKGELSYGQIRGEDEAATGYPMAMNSGCIAASTVNEICSQVLAIVWSDWTVTLLSHQLKILWRSKPINVTFAPKLKITEISVLIVTGNKSVFGESGLVIVGGVLNLEGHKTPDSTSHDHVQRSQANKTAEEISRERAGVEPEKKNGHTSSHNLDPALARYIGHFTTYALDGSTGKIRWKHEPGDFETKQERTEEQESLHFKLRLKRKSLHRGEVHWKKYSHSFISHLPYSWTHITDTSISLGEFERSISQADKTTERNIAEQLMALAKSGISYSPPKQEHKDLNSVVIRHSRGVEVLNLDKGSPVCSLPLDSRQSTLADVNGDGDIDLVKVWNGVRDNLKSDCFLVARDALVTSSVLFNSSITHSSQIGNFLGEVVSSFDVNIKSLPPLLIKTVKRSFGILPHVLGHGLSRHHVGMDTVVLTSSGRLSAFEPSGRFLWQVGTAFTWSETDSFIPSMKAISSSSEGTQDSVIILGSHELMVISLLDGSVLSTHSLPCVPTQPLVLGDINNDISDEFLVRCSDRYIAFSLERYNRIWLTLLVYSGMACLVGFVLFIIKFFEREEFPFDTFDHALKALRLFPLQGAKL